MGSALFMAGFFRTDHDPPEYAPLSCNLPAYIPPHHIPPDPDSRLPC
jgi:hypothetical protein